MYNQHATVQPEGDVIKPIFTMHALTDHFYTPTVHRQKAVGEWRGVPTKCE